MIKNLFIIVLLALILFLLYKQNKPQEQPKSEISVKIGQNEIKAEIPKIPNYIKFYDVKVGAEFVYNGRKYVKISNYYWTQPPQDPIINGNLLFPPFYYPQPINNARLIAELLSHQRFLFHFETNTMVQVE